MEREFENVAGPLLGPGDRTGLSPRCPEFYVEVYGLDRGAAEAFLREVSRARPSPGPAE